MRVVDWDGFASSKESLGPDPGRPLAVTVGVFDGVHIGHQALISRIRAEASCVPTVVTFRQNPLKTTNPAGFAGDIYSLELKLFFLEALGAELAVLIDFSGEFSKIDGRDFVNLLLSRRPVKLLALGEDFRCGHGLNVGAAEIRSLALARGVETWLAPPVTEGGLPVSSSRIRRALALGQVAEAEKLLGRPLGKR